MKRSQLLVESLTHHFSDINFSTKWPWTVSLARHHPKRRPGTDLIWHLHPGFGASVSKVKLVVRVDLARIDASTRMPVLLVNNMQISAIHLHVLSIILVALPLVIVNTTAVAARLVNLPL